jgi:hypothetical protein
MSDEKWWFSLVSRTFAKMCPALGIEKEVFSVDHKKHISKVMAHATVGYVFNGALKMEERKSYYTSSAVKLSRSHKGRIEAKGGV